MGAHEHRRLQPRVEGADPLRVLRAGDLPPQDFDSARFAGELLREGIVLVSARKQPPGTKFTWDRLVSSALRWTRSADEYDAVWIPAVDVGKSDTELLTMGSVVASCRGDQLRRVTWDPRRSQELETVRRILQSASLVHCDSPVAVDLAVTLGADAATTRFIPPAVDLEMFHPISESEMRQTPLKLTAVGPLDWTANLESSLRSLRRALDLGVDAHLELIGDGPDLPHLRFTIDDLDLGDRVEFAGRQPPEAVARRLRQADIFLASGAPASSVEPLLQAMASGLPVIASRIGGTNELVDDGIDGVLVQTRDPDGTAESIARLAADVRSRVRMGAAGRQRACAEFSSRRQAIALSALFHEAVRG